MAIQLVINKPRPEIWHDGWALLRTAGALTFAYNAGGRYVRTPSGYTVEGGTQIPGDTLWVEPEKGVLMLKPNGLSSGKPIQWLNPGDLTFTSGDLMSVHYAHRPNQPILHLLTRATPTSPIAGISQPISAQGFDVEGLGLRWIAETKSALYANESWSVTIVPFGSTFDGSEAVAAICFGARFVLVLFRGSMELHRNFGSQSEPEWRCVTRAQVGLSKTSNSEPFQVSVIPWGIDCISFVVTNGPLGTATFSADYTDKKSNETVLFEGKRFDIPLEYSSELRQYLKTGSGAWSIALPRDSDCVGFAMNRMRFSEAGFSLMPERIGEVRDGAAMQVDPIGFWGQRRGIWDEEAGAFLGPGSSVPGARAFAPSGEEFDSSVHTEVVGETWLRPSGDGVYSPEVWAFSYSLPPSLGMAEGEGVDLTSSLRVVRGGLSVKPDASYMEAEVKFEGDSVPTLLHTKGAVELTVDDNLLFEGHWDVSRSELQPLDFQKGVEARVEKIEAADLWGLANSVPASHFTALTNCTFSEVIREALLRLGASDEEILIDPELNALTLDGFVAAADEAIPGSHAYASASDWKIVNENGTVGDVLRALIERFGAQGLNGGRELRVVRRNGTWHAYLSPMFEGVVEGQFFSTDGSHLAGLTDQERFEQNAFRMYSQPKVGLKHAEFNALQAYASVGSKADVEAVACFIAPNPYDLSDPSSRDYCGVRKTLTLGPPNTALASSQNELERLARSLYDRDGKPKRKIQFEAEWNPAIQPDMFFELVVPAPFDAEDGRFSRGDAVSLGAWRLEEIRYEISARDSETNRFNWRAQYSASYCGEVGESAFERLFDAGSSEEED